APFRWTVVRQLDAEPSPKPPKTGKTPEFPDFRRVVVLQKSYECPECGKTFGCRSHFAKHRRTHTG
ncbi:ZN774 protein, partial [Brachypodius atriceps]|nr:ZN774 protein [Brachypodius atriceps]